MSDLPAINLLATGGVVAVIGARRSNVGDDLWEHPRIAFLESEEAAKRGLPSNTRAVIFTRFMAHTTFAKVMKEARARQLVVYPHSTTGELKKQLQALVAGATPLAQRPPEPEPIAPPATGPAYEEADVTGEDGRRHALPKGYLKAIIEQHPDEGPEDILMRVRANGRATSLTSVKQCVYKYRGSKLALIGAPARKAGSAVTEAAMGTTTSAADDLVRLVDDAIAALQLVREAAVRQGADRAALRETIAKLGREL